LKTKPKQAQKITERSEEKSKLYEAKNLNTLKNVIFLLDGYRIHHYEEIGWVDRAVEAGDLGWKFRMEWDDVRSLLMDMATLPKSLVHLLRWANMQSYLKLLGLIVSTLGIGLIGISLFLFWGRQPGALSWTVTILTYLSVPIIAGMVISFIGPILIARRIFNELDRYRQAHRERFNQYALRLKTIVQNLIDSLIHSSKKGTVKPKEGPPFSLDILGEVHEAYRGFFNRIIHRGRDRHYPHSFELFNTDYSGIEILKRPTRFRKYYIVNPEA